MRYQAKATGNNLQKNVEKFIDLSYQVFDYTNQF